MSELGEPPIEPQNLLLRRLPEESQAFLARYMTRLDLPVGAELHVAGAAVHQVYFPTAAVVALLHEAAPGRQMTMALIDHGGMVGTGALLGTGVDATRAVVQVAGQALRLDAGHLRGEFERSAAVRQLLLGWVQSVMTQVVHAATCARFHTTEGQLCHRLLQLGHHQSDAEIAVTQEQLAEMVGVRRERVNQLIGELEAGSLIRLRRGRLALLQPGSLAKRACDCHDSWVATLEFFRRGGR